MSMVYILHVAWTKTKYTYNNQDYFAFRIAFKTGLQFAIPAGVNGTQTHRHKHTNNSTTK